MKQLLATFIVLLATSVATFSSERITNFASPKTVYDVDVVGDFIYVATSGGLYCYNEKTGYSNLRPTTESFPDPAIRALATDPSGNLWVGTDEGYLMRKDPQGNEYITRAYVAAGWRILDLKPVGDYLVVASNKGVSLFDRKTLTVFKNASKFKDFQSSQINVITTFKNRLYVGGESGVAVLKGTLGEMGSKNFYDPAIWEVDTSQKMTSSCLVEDGKLTWYNTPAAIFNGLRMVADGNSFVIHYKVDADTGIEDADSTESPVKTSDTVWFDSDVMSMKVIGGNRCWIGLENDFYFYYQDQIFEQRKIPGPSFTSVKRIHVDRNGILWTVPIPFDNEDLLYTPPWWLGINAKIGSDWKVYGPKEYPEMGHMGRGVVAQGLLEAKDGSLWYGFGGGAIKRYDVFKNEWSHYCNWGRGAENGAFVKVYGRCREPTDYGKCDAIAQDSAGYIWFSSWNNWYGCLLCYKPEDNEDTSFTGLVGNYKRFPPVAFEGNEVNITAIAADNSGNIIYGTVKGEVTVVTYDGNPIEDSIRTVVSYGTDLGLQNVYNMLVISDGSTLILTTDGVYRYDPQTTTLTNLEDFEKNITSIALESDNVYWYASPGKGLTRFDVLNNTKKVIDQSQGLLSDNVNDVVFDKRNGYVWAATDRGVSRITLGYSNSQATKNNQQVFPNPFSLRRHKMISFQNIPADAKVSIHALSGNLVGVAKQIRSGVEGAYFEWRPSSDIAPGTYFYAVNSSADVKKSGRLLIIP